MYYEPAALSSVGKKKKDGSAAGGVSAKKVSPSKCVLL